MADAMLYPLKYLIAGFLLLLGWLAFWLVATVLRAGSAALRWCWRRAVRVVA